MPRFYSKKGPPPDFYNVVEAIKLVKIHKNSIRSAARATKITHGSLARSILKLDEAKIDISTVPDRFLIEFLKKVKKPGAKPLFTVQQEETLMQCVLKASEIYHGLSVSELRSLAYQYAKKVRINYPASWDENSEASKDWYYAFKRRHLNLPVNTSEQVNQNRTKSFNEGNVNAFFNDFSFVLHDIPSEPQCIWDMDDCRTPIVPTGDIIVEKCDESYESETHEFEREIKKEVDDLPNGEQQLESEAEAHTVTKIEMQDMILKLLGSFGEQGADIQELKSSYVTTYGHAIDFEYVLEMIVGGVIQIGEESRKLFTKNDFHEQFKTELDIDDEFNIQYE